MHEMSLAAQLLDIAIHAIPDDLKGARVERVNLRVGRLTSVAAESLRFCFDALAEGTPLNGAELVIEEIPVKAQCRDCGHEWTIDEPVFLCRQCRSGALSLLSGQELEVASLEIDTDD